jgi:alcohol dehydrogenase
MRQYIQTGYGDLRSNIQLIDSFRGIPVGTELLVDMDAASLNPIDYKIVHGDLKRAEKIGFPAPMGFDGSGVVAAVGPAPAP